MERCAEAGDNRAIAVSVDWTEFLARGGQGRGAAWLDGIGAEAAENAAELASQGWAEALDALPSCSAATR